MAAYLQTVLDRFNRILDHDVFFAGAQPGWYPEVTWADEKFTLGNDGNIYALFRGEDSDYKKGILCHANSKTLELQSFLGGEILVAMEEGDFVLTRLGGKNFVHYCTGHSIVSSSAPYFKERIASLMTDCPIQVENRGGCPVFAGDWDDIPTIPFSEPEYTPGFLEIWKKIKPEYTPVFLEICKKIEPKYTPVFLEMCRTVKNREIPVFLEIGKAIELERMSVFLEMWKNIKPKRMSDFLEKWN